MENNNCEPTKSCGQVNIPELDNSQDCCENITTTDCVNLVKDYLSLQVRSTENLTVLLDAIIERLFKGSKFLQALSLDENTGILTATLTDLTTVTVDLSSLSGGIESVVGGTNITIDNTDPDNPIINGVFTDTNTTNQSLTSSKLNSDVTITLTDSDGNSLDTTFTENNTTNASLAVTGDETKTITLTDSDGNIVQANFTDNDNQSAPEVSLDQIEIGDGAFFPANNVQEAIEELINTKSDTDTTNQSFTNNRLGSDITLSLIDTQGGSVTTTFTDLQGVESIVAGANIAVDNTDPANPVVSSTGGGVSNDDGTIINFNKSLNGLVLNNGFGVGKVRLTNGQNTMVAVDGLDFNNNDDSKNNPFYYGIMTVVLDDGTYRYFLLDSNTDSTNGTFIELYDEVLGGTETVISTVWDQPTGDYNWYVSYIGKVPNDLTIDNTTIVLGSEGGKNFGFNSIVTGFYPNNEGNASIIGGSENNNTGDNTLIVGGGHDNSTNDVIIGGAFSDLLPYTNFAKLVIGNGVATNSRSNALVVLQTGEILAPSATLSSITNSPDPKILVTREWVQNNGGIESVVGGTNITIDNTDPANPVVSSDIINEQSTFIPVIDSPDLNYTSTLAQGFYSRIGNEVTVYIKFTGLQTTDAGSTTTNNETFITGLPYRCHPSIPLFTAKGNSDIALSDTDRTNLKPFIPTNTSAILFYNPTSNNENGTEINFTAGGGIIEINITYTTDQ